MIRGEVILISKKSVTNEELCAAILTHGTIKEVASVLNISERTVYNMMGDSDFKKIYGYAQADILNNTVVACQGKMVEAVNCIADIMNDKEVNAQTRLQAAQAMLKNAVSMYRTVKGMREEADQEHLFEF